MYALISSGCIRPPSSRLHAPHLQALLRGPATREPQPGQHPEASAKEIMTRRTHVEARSACESPQSSEGVVRDDGSRKVDPGGGLPSPPPPPQTRPHLLS